MVQLIAGQKGKGKTTEILSRVNEEVKTAAGNIVFIDRNSEHMFELNNKVRLIDVSGYPITNRDEFIGFICGIISQDHDIQSMYLDRFMKCARITGSEILEMIMRLDRLSDMFNINFIISVSLDKDELPEEIQDKVLIAL